MDKKEIILTGLGGQGIVKSGIILAEAAVLEGKYVVQTQNYGPESRGGCCRADVIISNDDIYYPRVSNANIIIALTQSGYDKFKEQVSEEAVIIVDDSVEVEEADSCVKLPIVKTSEEELKNPQSINMVCLGALAALTNIIKYDNLKKAIEENVPKATIEKNLIAFDKGISIAKKVA